MKRFGQIIRQALKDKGMRGIYLADQLGISRSYVSGLSTCKLRPPKASMIVQMSKALSLDPEMMLCVAWLEKRPKGLGIQAIYDFVWKELDSKR
jgi:transcriptional regulator with XRE-family HTH domain